MSFDFEQILDAIEQDPQGIPSRILNAAIGQFAKGGLESARTQAIAAAARVAIGSLHFHFRDKKTLYEAACISASRSYGKLLAETLANTKPETPKTNAELIDSFVDAVVRLFTHQPNLARLLFYRFATVEPFGHTERHVNDMRVMQAMLTQQFEKCNSGAVDVQMLILLMYFATLLMFANSDVQTLFLGMSPDNSKFTERFRVFACGLLKAVLL